MFELTREDREAVERLWTGCAFAEALSAEEKRAFLVGLEIGLTAGHHLLKEGAQPAEVQSSLAIGAIIVKGMLTEDKA